MNDEYDRFRDIPKDVVEELEWRLQMLTRRRSKSPLAKEARAALRALHKIFFSDETRDHRSAVLGDIQSYAIHLQGEIYIEGLRSERQSEDGDAI